MSRPRKSPHNGKEKVKATQSTLPPAYASKAGGNPYVVYVHYKPKEDGDARVLVHTFLAQYAAKWFLLKLIGNDEWEYEPWKYRAEDITIVTSRGVSMKMHNDQIKQIMAHEMTEEESDWSDPQIAGGISYLKFGLWENRAAHNDNVDLVEGEDGEMTTEVKRGKKHKQSKAKTREAKPKKELKVKVDKTGMVTAGELAGRMGIKPSDFRAVLRKLKMTKPSSGWLFSKDEAEDIMAKVKKALK